MKKHLKNIDYPLLVVILILSLLGLVMVYSASFVSAGLDPDINDPAYYFKRQGMWLFIGLIVFFLTSMFSYRQLGKLTPFILLTTALLLILVLIPGIGVERNGAQSWINLGFSMLQPAELAKISMILYFALAYTKKQDKINSFNHGVLPPIILLIGIFGLIIIQPDFGTAVSILIPCGIILVFAGVRFVHILGLGIVALALVAPFALFSEYRRSRITSFMSPFEDPSGDGYQIIHSLISIATGQINGVGLSNSVQKAGYLPEAHTDFILAVIAEELGLIGSLIVVISFMFLMFKGILIAKRAPDQFGRLLALGITFQIITQAIINMGAVTALLPITGITLPLISYGGSSLIITFTLLGILMNIAIKGNILRGYNREEVKEEPEESYSIRSV